MLGLQKVIITEFRAELKEPLDTEFSTGITTSISVNSSITNFKVGSTFKIDSEEFTVIGLDYINNRVNVKRQSAGPSYGSGAFINNVKNEFSFLSSNILDITETNDISYFSRYDTSLFFINLVTKR